MRATLRAYQLSEFRYVHRSIACAMKTGNAAAFPHKTAEATQDLRIRENLSIAAVEEHGVVIQNFRILQIVQIVAEYCLICPGRLRHLLDGEIGVRRGVMIVSPGRD